ncbi:MAG: hypothetical protein JXP73_07070, partial [Deltaproteobacteria bacterium]|nr:hypothetical protein [Deltaproteobacteria bacterium]
MKLQSIVFAMAIPFGMILGSCGGGASGTSPGSGGSTPPQSGGTSGSGGVTASGGSSRAGGVTGSGGSSGSGGTRAQGGSTSSGGTRASGGSSGSGGGGGSCENVTPCGGDVLGTWNVTSSCLKVSGQFDPSAKVGLACTTGTVTGSLDVTGKWTAKSGGTYTDETVTKGEYLFTLPPVCKELSGTTVNCEGIGRVLG